jgi:thiopeptide-type bacteriocin biosynthesis protein
MYFSVEFRPAESPEVFLARALKPFLEQYIRPTRGARAFYSRHEDENGTLIRIRMRGEDTWTEDLLKPAFEGWMRDRGSWQEVPFQPDASPYGGEEVMVWVEEHFHIGTRVVLDRIATPEFTYGDAMFDTLRLFTTIAEAAGFSREKARWYYGELLMQWLQLFAGASNPTEREDRIIEFRDTLKPQQSDLSLAIEKFWTDMESGKYEKEHPEWARWHKGSQLIFEGLGVHSEKSLPTLIHQTGNRMGLSNPDIVYLVYVLSTSL